MKHYKFYTRSLFVCAFVLAFTLNTLGQTCIPLGGSNPISHTQNFDGLGLSSAPQFNDTVNILVLNPSSPRVYLGKFDNAVADNGSTVNLPGWAIVEIGNNLTSVTGRYAIGNGSSNGPNTYSFGTNGDRALGSINDDSVSEAFMGGCFTNTSVGTVTEVTIGFTGEMWRRGASGAQTDRLSFEYAVGATNLHFGTYTPNPTLDFVTPDTSGTAGPRDGNDAQYRTVVSAVTFPVTIGSGQSLYVRWADRNISGPDDGLAIDDVEIGFFGASSAPVTVAGRAITAEGRALSRTIVTLQSMTGETRTAITNPFGYYSFPDVTSGEPYIISAFAKGQEFATPSRLIEVMDSLMNVDFVTVPMLQAKPQTSSRPLNKK